MKEVISNGLGVKNAPTQHLFPVGHEGGVGGRERGVEAVVEEDEVEPAIVQGQGAAPREDQSHQAVWGGGGV